MFSRPANRIRLSWPALLLLLTVGVTGCSSLKLPPMPNLPGQNSSSKYVGIEPGFEPNASASQAIYNKVREASAQNSIVLQVVGDDPPLRLLPLPPEEKSVFVSDLIKQTGVQRKLGAIDAILYRQSPGSIGGIKMVVKMSPSKQTVMPESDYALRAGDRLRVEKAVHPGLEKLVGLALGL